VLLHLWIGFARANALGKLALEFPPVVVSHRKVGAAESFERAHEVVLELATFFDLKCGTSGAGEIDLELFARIEESFCCELQNI
jgi:hypothetical protein